MFTMARHPKAETVERALEAAGKNANWLARKLGVHKQSVYKWLTDTIPRDEAVFDRMLELIPPPVARERSDLGKGFAQPAAVRSWRGALAGWEDDECYFEPEEYPAEVPTAFLVPPGRDPERHEVVRISGQSMTPRIRSGDRVVIYRDKTLFRRSIVLAASPDPEKKVYLKKLDEGPDGRFLLMSISSEGSTFEDLTGWEIYGYAVAILTDMDEPGPNVEWRDGRPLRA